MPEKFESDISLVTEAIKRLNTEIREMRKLTAETGVEPPGLQNAIRSFEHLNALLDKYNKQVANIKSTTAAPAGSSSSGAGSFIRNAKGEDPKIDLSKLGRNIIAETEKQLSNSKQMTATQTAEKIANQKQVEILKQYLAERKAAEKAQLAEKNKQLNYAKEQTKVEQAGVRVSYQALEKQKRIDAAKAKEAAKAEELANLRNRISTNPIYSQYVEQLRARGLDIGDIQSSLDRGGNIEKITASRNVGGINRQFQGYVNQTTGRSTPGLSSQFRTFGSDILRDIGQFTKWSIAVAAVYTPLQKLGELMSIMVDNESKLADAAVAANIPFEQSGVIFDAVYEAANRAGEGLTGVIDAYAQAYRAAGRYEDVSERQAKATSLLNDSLTLSKLSTLDQSGAIDTLSAALLQSGRELDGGTELLNKWVRVSQIANVDITSLATGVAVLGDSAETAGLDIDKLNGLIAVLAEQSISGSKEAANTAKALIGAYQSDKSEAVLNRYGVALRKTNGEVRNFLDIYRDLARLRSQGILSDAAVSELALALGGGGVRRAKDASALINSYDRLNKIAEESSLITGESSLAQESLAKKLETVQTAATKASNAFQGLAQTLGNDGGLLDLFKGLLAVITGVTKGADDLFRILGRSGPILATFATAMLALRRMPPGTQQSLLASLGGTGQFAGFLGGVPQYGQITSSYGRGIGGYGRGVLGDILQLNKRGGSILGGAAVIGAGVSNLQAGRDEQAIANVVGGLIGAAIGGSLSGGVGIAAGAAIGSSMADSFVTAVLDYAPEWQKLFAPEETTKTPGETKTLEDERKVLLDRLKTESGINQVPARIIASVLRNAPSFLTKNFPGSEEYRKQISAEQVQLGYAPEELRRQIQRQEELRKIQSGEFLPAEGDRYKSLRKRLEEMATQERQAQLSKLSSGEITPSQFGRTSQQLTGFPSIAIQSVESYGGKLTELSKDINSVEDAYQAFLYIAANGNDEQITQLSRYSTDIRQIQYLIDNWNPDTKGLKLSMTFGDVEVESPEQLAKILSGLQTEAATSALSIKNNIRLQELSLPGIVGSATEGTSRQDVEQIKSQAEKLQNQFYSDMNLTNEEIEYLAKNLNDFAVLIEEAGNNHFETISGIDQKFWDAAQKLLVEQGKLKEEKGIGFQKFDVPFSVLQTLAEQSLQIGQNWQDRFNYDFKPEDQIAIDNQGIVQPLHADFKILALLLEKIVDQNQKQLDGQYNIPEGATFWVPLTAAYYRNKGGSGGIGDALSNLDTSSLDNSANNLDGSAVALTNAADAFNNYLAKEDAATAQLLADLKSPYKGDIPPQKDDIYKTQPDIPKQKDDIYLGPKEQDLPGGTPAFAGTGLSGLLDSLRNSIQNFFSNFDLTQTLNHPGLKDQTSAQSVPTAPASKLDIRMESTTNLMLDGRVLATALQNYLASELLRTEGTQGTITKRYII